MSCYWSGFVGCIMAVMFLLACYHAGQLIGQFILWVKKHRAEGRVETDQTRDHGAP